jgi:TonB family protein
VNLHRQHFGMFIAISLAVHAAVLTAVMPHHDKFSSEQNFGIIDIELLAKNGVSAESISHTVLKQTGLNQKNMTPAVTEPAVTEPSVVEIIPTETGSQNLSEPSNPNRSSTQNNATADLIKQKITSEFSRYFYYPDAARRRNWQGDVVLQFTLLPDGHLNQIRIHQSSGVKSLDEAAVHALQQVAPQQELALLTDAALLHILPVSYRLTNPL